MQNLLKKICNADITPQKLLVKEMKNETTDFDAYINHAIFNFGYCI